MEVRLGVSPEGEGVSLVGGETLRFVRGMQSATTSVFVTRDSSLSAFSVSPLETTLSLTVDNASFTTATSLSVDVLDRRVYSLAFEPSAVGVVANSSLGLRLSLVGTDGLLSGEEVSVSLDVSRGSGLSLSTSQVSFDSDSTSVEVRLDAEASASASTATATVQGELPAGIDVSGAMADVSVLPRELRLSFPSSPLLVLSGLDTSVELTLLGAMSLTATESVGVSLVGLSDSGFGIDPSSLSMGRSTPSVSLSLMVPRELESAELTAEASSLPMNAVVSSTSVEIRVLPREYALSFSPSALSIVAGTTGSATLSLEGAYGLLSEESVTVSLSVAGADVEGVSVSPVEVSFDKVSTSVEVEVEVLSSVVAATTRLQRDQIGFAGWFSDGGGAFLVRNRVGGFG